MKPGLTNLRDNRPGWPRLLPGALCVACFHAAVGIVMASPETNGAPAIISFEFSRGRIMLPVRVGNSPPMSFMLDTGYTMAMISPERAEALQLKRVGEVTIAGVAGNEKAAVFSGVSFDLAGATYSPRRVAVLPSESQSPSRRRDGILGHGLFKQFVVEIDHKAKQLRLHEPEHYEYSGPGEVIPLTFHTTTPVVEATITAPDGSTVKGRFEIDTGCSGALCLGHDFVEENKLIGAEDATRNGVRRGVGGDVKTRMGHVPRLQVGTFQIDKPSANFFLEGSPVDAGFAGHIGMQVLREFKVIFDYSRRRMILEPYRS